MKAVCDTCGARYRIPDEKAAGKVLQIRCRKCGNIFKYEGASAARQARAPKGDWFFAIDGESFGPYTQRELLRRFESGKLGLNTHVWKEGFSDWMPVAEHPEFAAAVELSKDSIRRLGAQRPQSGRTTEGSGRFTVDIRRPGATMDEDTQAQRDALDDEVDHAFQALIGQPADPKDNSDDSTPTTPMRVFAARKAMAASDTSAAQKASSGVSSKRSTPHADTARPARAAAIVPEPRSAEPLKPAATSTPARAETAPTATESVTKSAAKSTPAKQPQRMSLSERLQMIRERSADGGASSGKSASLPARNNAAPSSKVTPSGASPTSSPTSPDAAKPDRSEAASEDDTPTGPLSLSSLASEGPTPSARSAQTTPPSSEAVAPIPSGPIRQVTQEINVDDLFDNDGDLPEPGEPAPAVPVPSDEDLRAHLSKRKEARAKGVLSESAVDPDAPPYILGGASTASSPSKTAERAAAATPYRLDGVTDEYDDEPPYILDGTGTSSGATSAARSVRQDDVTPVGGTAAVQPTPTVAQSKAAAPKADKDVAQTTARDTAHDAAQTTAQNTALKRNHRLLILILVLTLVLLLLIAGWFWLSSSNAASTVGESATQEEASAAPIDRTDVVYARNRARGIVAQSVGAGESSAYVAAEKPRNSAARHAPSRGHTPQRRATKPSAGTPPIEFTTASSTNSRLGVSRENTASGPSEALFDDTIRSTVSRSVARCAQRTRGIEGFLPVARLQLSITIASDGTVQRVKAQREAHSGPLMVCISNESQRWSFPKFTGKPTTISRPFVLQ